MKGIIFREFISMVETQFSLEMADEIISASTLQTEGAYTTVGTYPVGEMVELLSHLSARSGVPVPELLRAFGRYLFERFSVIHADYVKPTDTTFSVLRQLDGHIHAEVRKLYSDTELPSFSYEDLGDGSLQLDYRSRRPLADLAEGLLQGCIAHFNESLDIERIDYPCDEGAYSRFILSKTADVQAG